MKAEDMTYSWSCNLDPGFYVLVINGKGSVSTTGKRVTVRRENRNALTIWFVLGVSMVLGCVGIRLWYRRWRRARIAARRIVERPNSYYSSAIVKHQVDQARWRRVDLDRIHPVNREEVERLLAVASVQGPEALSSRERLFLETMTELSPG